MSLQPPVRYGNYELRKQKEDDQLAKAKDARIWMVFQAFLKTVHSFSQTIHSLAASTFPFHCVQFTLIGGQRVYRGFIGNYRDGMVVLRLHTPFFPLSFSYLHPAVSEMVTLAVSLSFS